MAGLWCVSLGYGRQELVDAATRQMQQLPYYNSSSRPATPAAELATLLAEITPPTSATSSSPARAPGATTPCCAWCATTGPAKGQPDKQVIISRHNAYHGSRWRVPAWVA